MRYDRYPESIFRLLGWTTAIILLGGVIAIQVLPLTETQCGLLNVLVVASGAITFILRRYILPRAWHRVWVFYLAILVYISAIAVADATLYPLDLSPLYGIITVAVIADLRVALFAAALASALHFGVVLGEGGYGADWRGRFLPHGGVLCRCAARVATRRC